MFDEDGKFVTASQVVFVALAARRDVCVLVRRSDDTLMSTLRLHVRRAAKLLDVRVRISILTDTSMTVVAVHNSPEDSVRRAMDLPTGI